MTEYIDYPRREQISHIDASYGREYDPYPDSRAPRRPSQGSASFQSPRQHSGPPIAPLHVTPVPQVRRLTNSSGEPPRTPMVRSPPAPGTPMLRSPPAPGTPMLRSPPAPYTPTVRSPPAPNTPMLRSSPGPNAEMMRSPPPRTPIMQSPPAPSGLMPGAARFREADNAEPTRWTQAPTNVSYPASQAASWISTNGPQQHMRAESSFFVPRGASTPAPQSRYGEPAPSFPGGFRDEAPLHYDPPPRQSDEHPQSFDYHPDQYEAIGHYEGDESYRKDQESYVDDSGYPGPSTGYVGHGDETRSVNNQTEEFEEELIPASFLPSDGEPEEQTGEQTPEVTHEERSLSNGSSFRAHSIDQDRFAPKPKKGFVGGFFSGFKHLPRMWSSSRSGKSTSVQPPMSANPSRPTLARSEPSYTSIHAQDPARPPNPAPETTADISRMTDTTATSHSGPITPDQSGEPGAAAVAEEAGPLPNPYDPSLIPQPNIASPQHVVLQQTEDYDAMTEEPSYDQHPDTFGTHINRVGKFVKDFVHLPWINAHATVEYRPADSRRAFPKKPGQSWYVKENHEKLDLLAGPSPQARRATPRAAAPRQTAPRQHRAAQSPPQRARSPLSAGSTRSLDAATAIRPTVTPGSLTTHGGLVRVPSPGASSHGQTQHSYSYAYYGSRPMYVYPAQVAGQHDGAGAAMSVPAGFPGALPLAMPPSEGGSPQAIPVFMLAAPPPYGNSRSASPKKHRRHHSGRRRNEQKGASSSSPPPPMPAPQIVTSPA